MTTELVLAALLGYATGSIPFAHLLSRRRGIDLRLVGSGNVGATNVLRTSGVASAIVAMCLDAAKGSAAVLIAQRLSSGPVMAVTGGLASIVGHIYPVWLGFKGGKGVATAAGVFAMLTPAALGLASAAFVIAVVASGYISIGSLAGAVTLAAIAVATATSGAIAVGAVTAALLIFNRHRGNIARLRSGTERRVGVRL